MAQPPHRRGALSVLVFLFLLPWRLIALFLLAVMVIPGVVMMWRLPALAQSNDLDLCLLSLRVIDRQRTAAPLAPLGYQAAVEKHLIDLCPDLGWPEILLRDFTLLLYRTDVSSVERVQTEGGAWHYQVRYHNGATKQVAFTTPHLNVPPDELARARNAVSRIFKKKQEVAEVQQWGESLFWTEWLRVQSLYYTVHYDQIPAPAGGTPDEQLWLAWTVLRGDNPAAEEELFRLPELFAEAFPKAADRAAALAWARRLCERMEADFQGYQKYVQACPGYKPEDRKNNEQIFTACPRVLPPKTAWTHYWLLYRYVGLSESSRAAALEHWRGWFPAERYADVVAFGETVLEERLADDEPLPPVPDVLPWLCAVERLTGTDACGGRCRTILDREFGVCFSMLKTGVQVANPNDEFFYLEASADPLRLYPNSSSGATWRGKIFRLGNSVCFIAVIQLGVSWIIALAARALLRGRSRELWEKHTAGRGKGRWWRWLIAVPVVAVVGALIAPMTLDESMALHTASYPELFAAAAVATLVGGMLIGTCRRALAVVLVMLGVDVERTWLDEALGILAGGLILLHFGAGLAAIALFALSDLIPAVIQTVRSRRQGALKDDVAVADVAVAVVDMGRMPSRLRPTP